MKKEDKITAEEIEKRKIAFKIVESNLSHRSGTNTLSIEEAVNAVVAGMNYTVPVQEQSKQEVSNHNCISYNEAKSSEPCKIQCCICKQLDKTLSLPQEQKDKVTGVRDEEIRQVIFQHSRPDEKDCVNFIAHLRSLLSSKAVEQIEPDGKEINWEYDVVSRFFSECTNQDYVSETQPPVVNAAPHEVLEFFKQYFSKPIQEAEHKQGVTMSSKRHKILDKSDIQKQVFSILSRHNVPNLMVISNDIADSLSLPLKEEQKSVTDDELKYVLGDMVYDLQTMPPANAIDKAHESLRSLFGEKGKED